MKTQTESKEMPPFVANKHPKHHKEIMDHMDYDMTHERGGNGWCIVQDLGDEMVRCSFIGKDKLGENYLCWTKMLSVTKVLSDPKDKNSPRIKQKVPDDLLAEIYQLRKDLKDGSKVCVSPRILKTV